MSDLKCKNCGKDNHPAYDKKYGGYCLDCWNADADEKDAKIAELKEEVRRLRGGVEELVQAATVAANTIKALTSHRRDDSSTEYVPGPAPKSIMDAIRKWNEIANAK